MLFLDLILICNLIKNIVVEKSSNFNIISHYHYLSLRISFILQTLLLSPSLPTLSLFRFIIIKSIYISLSHYLLQIFALSYFSHFFYLFFFISLAHYLFFSFFFIFISSLSFSLYDIISTLCRYLIISISHGSDYTLEDPYTYIYEFLISKNIVLIKTRLRFRGELLIQQNFHYI